MLQASYLICTFVVIRRCCDTTTRSLNYECNYILMLLINGLKQGDKRMTNACAKDDGVCFKKRVEEALEAERNR